MPNLRFDRDHNLDSLADTAETTASRLDEYRADLVTLSNELVTLTARVGEVEDGVRRALNQGGEHSARMTVMEDDLAALAARVAVLESKHEPPADPPPPVDPPPPEPPPEEPPPPPPPPAPTENALEWLHKNNLPMLLSRWGHRKPGSKYVSSTHTTYLIDSHTTYRPRSLDKGLDLHPAQPGQYILHDLPVEMRPNPSVGRPGYDYLLTPNYDGGNWNSTTPHIFINLVREARVVVMLKATAATPAWMQGGNSANPHPSQAAWTQLGTGLVNTTAVKFMMTTLPAGNYWLGGFSGALQIARVSMGQTTCPMLVALAESNGEPTPDPVRPPMLAPSEDVPPPGARIRDDLPRWGWLHEGRAHRVLGLDGKTLYSTWHAQHDEVTGALHGHDHGTDTDRFTPFPQATVEAEHVPSAIKWNGVHGTWEDLIVKANKAGLPGYEAPEWWTKSGHKLLAWVLPDRDTGHPIWYWWQIHLPTSDLSRIQGPMRRPTKFAMMYDPVRAPAGMQGKLICYYQGLWNWGGVKAQADTAGNINGVTFDHTSIGVGPNVDVPGGFRSIYVHQQAYNGTDPVGQFASYESWSPVLTPWFQTNKAGLMAFQLPGLSINTNEPMVNLAFPGFAGGVIKEDHLVPFNIRAYAARHAQNLLATSGNGVVRWMNWANLTPGSYSPPPASHAELRNGFGVNSIDQAVPTGGFWTNLEITQLIDPASADPSIHVWQFMRPGVRVRHQTTGKLAVIDIVRDGLYENNKAVFTGSTLTEREADDYLPARAIERATTHPN